LIKNAENKKEAIAIAELGTTYKRTGFHFDKKLEKIGSTIKYFKKILNYHFAKTNSRKLINSSLVTTMMLF
jgi:adenine-specific DNA-methyltransferase